MGRPGKTKVAAKAAKRTVHPNSRKAKQMNRATQRKARLERQKKKTNEAQFKRGVKMMWFKEAVGDKDKLMSPEVKQLISLFIQRNDEEMADLKATGANKSRLMVLEMAKKHEHELFNTPGKGFEAPRLEDPKVIQVLRNWNGELKDLPKIETSFYLNV